MATTIEYMLMSGAAYDSTRKLPNKTPYPAGWNELDGFQHRGGPVGFEAAAYYKGNEIVIAYAGTYAKDSKDKIADISLAVGNDNTQMYDAARYYLDIRAAYPDAKISFTGHSLGGGLAALMSVFFNQPAQTFDSAPFLPSCVGRISYLRNPPNKKLSINDEIYSWQSTHSFSRKLSIS